MTFRPALPEWIFPRICLILLLATSVTACASSDKVVRQVSETPWGLTTMPHLIGGLGRLQRGIPYPREARARRQEGRVVVQMLVGVDGRPREITIVESRGLFLDRAASDAVGKAVFLPAEVNGRPVEMKISLPITFRLR